MAELPDADPHPASVRRDRSIEARREARRKKHVRERRIVDLLNRGLSTAELAVREGVTLRRMQILVKTILARHVPQAPAEYLALQMSRLNEAMIVAYCAMSTGNLGAVDRVAKLVREMDRYNGFFPDREANRARRERLVQPPGPPLALAAPVYQGAMEPAPQPVEIPRSGDGFGGGGRPGRDADGAASV